MRGRSVDAQAFKEGVGKAPWMYEAVATVGDSVHDIRRYIAKVLQQRVSVREEATLGRLPPVWHSLRHGDRRQYDLWR